MLNFINRYKKYLIGIALAMALVFSFRWYISTKESQAYDRGFQSANVQWEKKGKQYVDMIDASRAQNEILNDKLSVLSEEKRKLEEARSKAVIQQQIDYSKSGEASKKCVDENLVHLYNDSLGE